MILQPTRDAINSAAQAIRSGELVAFPTETVYGLGANALDEQAVRKIFALKGRPATNPLIVHIANIDQISDVADIPHNSSIFEKLSQLAGFWPGPLSLILPKSSFVAPSTCANLPSVAVRIPQHSVALDLLRAAACPIAAPSANRSFYVSPTTAQHVADSFGNDLGIILDGGPCLIGLESTIVSLVSTPTRILRPGAITFEQLNAILPDLEYSENQIEQDTPLAPGMLKEHYAPTTRVTLLSKLPCSEYPPRIGIIAFNEAELAQVDIEKCSKISVLSHHGNQVEIAAKLFAALREHDQAGLDLILVGSCPQVGLGAAIMDRLLRATAKFD